MTNPGQRALREIRYDVSGGTATMTLHRPDRLNAFTATMAGELVAAFDLADADNGVRVVLLTGAGRGFCAGADLAGGRSTFAGRGGDPQAVGTIAGVRRDGGVSSHCASPPPASR